MMVSLCAGLSSLLQHFGLIFEPLVLWTVDTRADSALLLLGQDSQASKDPDPDLPLCFWVTVWSPFSHLQYMAVSTPQDGCPD